MTKTAKTVLLAIVALVAMCGIVVVGLAIWFFTSALESVPADEAQATRSFAEVRAKFANRTPLFELTDHGPVLADETGAKTAAGQIESVRVIAWNADEQKLATVSLPFWMLRMTDGPINVSASSPASTRLTVTADELERYGPTLLIDAEEEDGSRVLIWTE
jgi:hypothetical protein